MALACAAALLAPAEALAAPDCTRNAPRVRTLESGLGTLESAMVDRRGRLFFSSMQRGSTGELNRMTKRRDTPEAIVEGIDAPGGLALMPDGDLLLGYGNSIAGGNAGDLNPQAGLVRVNANTGATIPYAEGLGMANGVVRARDGTVFASNDFGNLLDRVEPDGTVEHGWAEVESSNGLVVDPSGRYLYAAQTFRPAAIQRIEIADPANVEPFFEADPADIYAGFDGMTRDRRGNLFVTANGAGELWRIGRDGTPCVIARGLGMPSAVARGRGRRNFKHGNLYVVNFGGQVVELRGAMRTRP